MEELNNYKFLKTEINFINLFFYILTKSIIQLNFKNMSCRKEPGNLFNFTIKIVRRIVFRGFSQLMTLDLLSPRQSFSETSNPLFADLN